MTAIIHEKLDQAAAILDELGIGAWLTFVRETAGGGDPALPLILGCPLTWPSALLLGRGGERVAIVGRFEAELVASSGAWTQVLPYDQDIAPLLREHLARLDPARLAINFSLSDPKADGLTHGMHELLRRHLEGTPYAARLESAEALLAALRGRKSPGELARIRAAVAMSEAILAEMAAAARPGWSEAEIAAFVQEATARRGAEPAWEADQCPMVTTGPESMAGHGLPSAALRVGSGRILHLDFGVRLDGYCADLQRSWYVPHPGEARPPADAARAFAAVRGAIAAAAAVLRPGIEGWRVDAAAREHLLRAGYAEYMHATGHQVGRAAHDGGAILGPCWARYGRTPSLPVEPGSVFTLELGVDLPGAGYLGLEEMVRVAAGGVEWLSVPQKELWLLAGSGA